MKSTYDQQIQYLTLDFKTKMKNKEHEYEQQIREYNKQQKVRSICCRVQVGGGNIISWDCVTQHLTETTGGVQRKCSSDEAKRNHNIGIERKLGETKIQVGTK